MEERNRVLLMEDFRDFPIGEFPYDKDASAMGEYQYIVESGYRGKWLDQVCNYTYRGSGPSWIITEKDGRHFMESMRIEKGHPHRMFPTLQTGNGAWRDYNLSAEIRRLSTKGSSGICFAMKHSMDTLFFGLRDGDYAELVYRHNEELTTLAEGSFKNTSDNSYRLEIRITGRLVSCLIDGEEVLNAETSVAERGGKAGISADCPTQFTDVRLSVSEKTEEDILKRIKAEAEEEEREQRKHPRMKLWRKINLKNFGTSRQIRFGHLTGDETWHIVLAQMQKRVKGDSYGFISCITAIDLEGNVLWQQGEPSDTAESIGKVSADMPLQVYDINGDGKDEVIIGRDFKIQILEGESGRVLREAATPLSDDDDSSLIGVDYQIYAFDRINPDGIRICNFRGNSSPRDILIKDRYCRLYALNDKLELLWKYKAKKNTGHCPMPIDINGDGCDELLAGYDMLDKNGRLMWSYPLEEDHTDEIVPGKFRNDGKGYFACTSGTQGFFIGDLEGNIVVRNGIGHAQRVSVANYCPERSGLEIAVVNFWGHQGVIYLYDCDGKVIWEQENEMNGNILSPVNWDGSGSELILTNADPERGGLLNGKGIRAVSFPDDGHPMLCCESIDLTGDERNELVVWDYHSMWIYTQEDNPGEQRYHPVQFPAWNASNYRGEYSYPDDSYISFV